VSSVGWFDDVRKGFTYDYPRVHGGSHMLAGDLIGVWIIQSFDVIDRTTGLRSQPWGEEPRGTVIFHGDGRMFAMIHASPRGNPVTDADRAAAFQRMLAYSGRFRLDPPNVLVTTVDMSWFEPWIGTEQARYADLAGDQLTLTSAPLDMPKETAPIFAVVQWTRESAVDKR
jgi:hypothetical protein